MNFPNTWQEYEESYGFNDTEHVYTNGSRLIQSFRVKQWLEHIEVSEDNEPTWDQVKEYCRRRGWMLMTVKEVSEIELRAYCQGYDCGSRRTYDELKMEIAEEIREGEWIDGECSCCGYTLETRQTRFCPECGARMEGAEE